MTDHEAGIGIEDQILADDHARDHHRVEKVHVVHDLDPDLVMNALDDSAN